MKKIMIAVAIAIWVMSWSGWCRAEDESMPVVERVSKVSGPYQGYKITCPAYEAKLECNQYGFFRFYLSKDGEKLIDKGTSSNPFTVYDDANKKYAFTSYKFHKDKKEFPIVEKPGKITWELSPCAVTTADYSGSLTYGPRRIALTHNWTVREDITGRAMYLLNMGMPLLIGCPFKALLADGTTVEGDIPVESELPKKYTVHAGGGRNKSIKEITFDTVKGKVKIGFIPDKNVDMLRQSQPFLTTIYREDYKPPCYLYGIRIEVPAGEKDIPRSYTIVFEFPE